jgi:import inner membrane translocase subunit TIM44
LKKVEKDSKPADEIEQSLFPSNNKNETMKQAASATLRAARRTPPTSRVFTQRPIASTSASLRSFSSSPLSRQQQQQETKEEPKEDTKDKKDEKKKPQEEDSTVEGRSPFAAFVEVLRDEVRKNREWQDSVKQLGGEVSKVQDSEAMKRAKEVYERARVRLNSFSSLSAKRC